MEKFNKISYQNLEILKAAYFGDWNIKDIKIPKSFTESNQALGTVEVAQFIIFKLFF